MLLVGIAKGLTQDGFYYSQTGAPVPAEKLTGLLPEEFDLFASDTPLELKIISDFKRLIKKKFNTEYQEAKLVFQWTDEIEVRRTIRIKARGESRRRICYMPPLKLNFSKTEFALKDLRDLDKMKMVSYCQKGYTFEQYLFKEYLNYQMYRLFSPVSFRARLINMTYVDTGRKNKEYEGYAFLIEEVDRLEDRLNAREVKKEKVHPDATAYEHVNIFSIFQFMIGNHDWSIPNLHNVKLLRLQEEGRPVLYAVPYDFDYSGLVNAHYAVPPERLDVKTIRDRVFRGFCRTEAEFEAAFEVFQAKKPEIYAMIESFPHLNQKSRRETLSYLDSFYEIISNEWSVRKYFLEACRK